ncbi:beta-glucosidase-domain-containing protein [Xylariaceae sp. FL0662B]|nr:beta-glucosidase-domain-containing protein [Xylariaceae sp. FL0662B]
MKVTTIQAVLGSAMLLLSAQPCAASVQHRHRHHHLHPSKKHARDLIQDSDFFNPKYSARNSSVLESRSTQKCKFPEDKGLFAVTPGSMNGGWALAPDQECASGTWCPFACPPGQVMAQWKPGTHYQFPESTYGGVKCTDSGEIEVPFPDKPWCVDGTGTVEAVNKVGEVVSFCQTCLPGFEDMIIPTEVHDTETLAVPDKSYWDSTASHFYVNPPGVKSEDGCVWGNPTKPWGNWSPFVAGANTESDGSTFVKVGLNPEWKKSPLSKTKPNFGLKIECPSGGCKNIPCKVDGTGVDSDEKTTENDSDFCVVTVPGGAKANIVVYSLDGSEGGAESPSSSSSAPQSPTTSSISTTSAPPPSSTSTSSSSSSKEVTTSSPTITSSTGSSPSKSPIISVTFLAGVFQENGTTGSSSSSGLGLGSSWTLPSSTAPPAAASTNDGSQPAQSESSTSENAGQRQGGAAVAGLVVAFVAAVYLL